MLTDRERRRFTPEEYLLLEERAEIKSEYCAGEIFAMTGGSLNHSLGELRQALRGRGCRAFGSDLRLYVERFQLFTYPDLRGPPPFLPGRQDTVTDARLRGSVPLHRELRSE